MEILKSLIMVIAFDLIFLPCIIVWILIEKRKYEKNSVDNKKTIS
jgi:hypothetical protein